MGEPELFLSGSAREPTLAQARTASSRPSGPPARSRGSKGATHLSLGHAERPVPSAASLTPELERLAREAGAEEIHILPDLETLRAVAESCTRCPLHTTRTNVVFADGSGEARVVCAGEAPGQHEDETGLPFVGRAGKLLDRLLLSVGLSRRHVFICNVLKCRPPQNRNPLPEEIERCSPFLRRQVELLGPDVVVAFGTFAAQTLLGSGESLGRLRGRLHEYEGYPLVVTYHPAALLRNPSWTRPAWEDLQLVRRILDGDRSAAPRVGTMGKKERLDIPSAASRIAARPAPNLQLSLGDDNG